METFRAEAGPEPASATNMSEALISLQHLSSNVAALQQKLDGNAAIMGIVKANAYGHNVHRVAATLEAAGINQFGVANIFEAMELKQGGSLKQPSTILAFSSPLPSHIPHYLNNDIDMTLCDTSILGAAREIAATRNKRLRVQVKIDTGMGRLGIAANKAMDLLREIDATPSLDLTGIYTHFAESATNPAFTRQQLTTFTALTKAYERERGKKICKHAANSGAILSCRDSWLDMVRPGILLYGYHPSKQPDEPLTIRPVMQMTAKVIYLKQVETGTSISYNRTWYAPARHWIATIAAGYADGYARALSGKTMIMINGKLYPQAGIITMDQLMVDLGPTLNVRVGDTAILFGWNGPSASELAALSGTICYETLCSVSSRVKRIFI